MAESTETVTYPEFFVTATCEQGHSQCVKVLGQTEEFVKGWAGLMDGTSPFYIRSPLGDPDSLIGKCGMCGAQIKCAVEAAPSLANG